MTPSGDVHGRGQLNSPPTVPALAALSVPPAVADTNVTAADALHDRALDAMNEIKPRLRGWLHAVTAPLAFLSFLVILVLADSTRVRIGLAVFMVSTLMLFTTSAIYHTGTWSRRHTRILKRLDHANIFVLIAGSSTPFAMLLLTEQHAVLLMTVMWGGAALGVAFKLIWIDAPRWVHVPLYLVLGWTPVAFAPDFLDEGQDTVLILLVAGGLLYSMGAIIYGIRRPNPSPLYFGYHEVFHSLTIAAFATHYVGVSLLVYS
jgi:hemolysin III